MKYSRLAVAATLSSALVLTACTGADTPTDEATSTAALSAPAPAQDEASSTTGTASSTADDSVQTTGSDDASTTTEMATDEAQAVLTVDEAQAIATKILDQRFAAFSAKAKKAKALQKVTFIGSARTAAGAATKLKGVVKAPAETKDKKAAAPNVLAISRDDGELPQLILVQTVPEDGVPVLHLMESRSGKVSDFRITWEAPMLPGTSVPTFDRRSVGSPVLRKGSGDLAMSPRQTLKELAKYTSWPQPKAIPDYRTHGYSPTVRDAAQAQAKSVEGLATLREKNWLISDDTRTLLFEDGTGLVLGTLLRDTVFTVNSGSVLTPPKTFTVFADDTNLTDEAVLRTMVFTAMRVPSKDVKFKPEMLAVREQLVDASGS